MRNHRFDYVGECTVAIIAIEPVRILEIIPHIDIGPTVFVIVPPGRRVPFANAIDTGCFGDFCESPIAVVSHEAIRLANRIMID